MAVGSAVLYIRVSTESQAVEGVSLEAQRARLEAWALANDFRVINTYVDAGLSGGRSDNRPGLQGAIADACTHRAVLVVYSLSRLARSTKDTIAIGERLSKSGADLVSLSEKIDTTSAAGKMIFRMLAVLAEFERDQISERTRMAMTHKKARSERIGTVPYGWDLGLDGKNLVSVNAEQETIRVICDLRSQRVSYRDIADLLTSREVKTKKGASQWTHTAVRSIFKREARQ